MSLKSNLNNGAIVQLRNGDKYIYLENARINGRNEDVFVGLKKYNGFFRARLYDDDLIYYNRTSFGHKFIVDKICDMECTPDNIKAHLTGEIKETWTWNHRKVKELTLSELREQYGCEVKIVED